MIKFRHLNHFNHPLAVSYSTPYVSSGYSSYDWGSSAAPSTSQHAVDPHPTTSFFGEMNSNFGNNSQQYTELTNAAECSGDPGSSHPSTMLDLTNSSRHTLVRT
jgi:hypothetical protein